MDQQARRDEGGRSLNSHAKRLTGLDKFRGASEASVQTSLGKPPEDRQQFQSKGFLTNEPANSSCIYYNRDGGSFGDRYQFCFDSGKLTSKNAY